MNKQELIHKLVELAETYQLDLELLQEMSEQELKQLWQELDLIEFCKQNAGLPPSEWTNTKETA